MEELTNCDLFDAAVQESSEMLADDDVFAWDCHVEPFDDGEENVDDGNVIVVTESFKQLGKELVCGNLLESRVSFDSQNRERERKKRHKRSVLETWLH